MVYLPKQRALLSQQVTLAGAAVVWKALVATGLVQVGAPHTQRQQGGGASFTGPETDYKHKARAHLRLLRMQLWAFHCTSGGARTCVRASLPACRSPSPHCVPLGHAKLPGC